jgi:signal transduction histidine kinase
MTTSIYELLALRPLSGRRAASTMVVLPTCATLVLAIAAGAYLSGYEVRLSVLYLAPIALATWIAGRRAGLLITLMSSASWTLTFWSSHPYSQPFYFYLEGGMTVAMFLIFVALLARLYDALESSDARLLTVLEGLDAAVHVEDARTGVSLYDNRRFNELFGSSRRFSQDAGEIYDGGSQSWYRLQSRTLRWTDGREAVLRMLYDITEEHSAREFAAMQREAAHRTSRMVALGEFASAIAHELTQPLTAISTYNNACVRLLQNGSYSVEELRSTMQKCRDQARRAGAIIQRLREILRHPIRPRAPLDLREVAANVLQIAAPDALESGVSLVLDAPTRLPRVRTDQLLVEQVALNLVRNAIEAVRELPPERRRVTIATSLESDGSVALCVADLGQGVPAEVNGRLFEAFVTTKPGGLGLGLSICRSVIESLGGSIRHDDNAMRGARFWFVLPAAEE